MSANVGAGETRQLNGIVVGRPAAGTRGPVRVGVLADPRALEAAAFHQLSPAQAMRHPITGTVIGERDRAYRFFTLAQVSRSPTVRLKTSASLLESSGSLMK